MMKPKGQTEHDEGMLEYLEDIIGSCRLKEPIQTLSRRIELLNEQRGEKVKLLHMIGSQLWHVFWLCWLFLFFFISYLNHISYLCALNFSFLLDMSKMKMLSFWFPAEPSEAGGKGEECFRGRKEQSCGFPHSGEWHLQTQESAVPVSCVSAPAPL